MHAFTRITVASSHPLDVFTFQLSVVSELCQIVVPAVQEPNFSTESVATKPQARVWKQNGRLGRRVGESRGKQCHITPTLELKAVQLFT